MGTWLLSYALVCRCRLPRALCGRDAHSQFDSAHLNEHHEWGHNPWTNQKNSPLLNLLKWCHYTHILVPFYTGRGFFVFFLLCKQCAKTSSEWLKALWLICLGWVPEWHGGRPLWALNNQIIQGEKKLEWKYVMQAKGEGRKKKNTISSSSTQGWQRIWLNEDKCLWTISNKIRSLTRLV